MHIPTRCAVTRIHLSVPHMSGRELGRVQRVLESGWVTTAGEEIRSLERAFERMTGCPAVALGNGTAALHLATKLVGLSLSNRKRFVKEVVVPTLTFAATANAVLYERWRPVFLDSCREDWGLDPQLLKEFLEARARENKLPMAVMVVHLFGQCADMDPILEVCRRYGVFVIEDAAECLGARYKGRVPGSIGDIGVYSFNGNKVITGGGGGMLVSPNAAWVEKARFWSTQARDNDPEGLHNYVHSELGYNYRMSNVLAAIVLAQLEVLDLRVQQRRAVALRYRDAFADLPGIELMPQAPDRLHTNWLSCFLIDETKFGMSAADLIRFLDAANVEARPVWRPMHMQPLYRKCECVGGAVAEDLHRRGLCLPSSSCLTEDQQQFVIERVREAHFKAKGRK